MPAKTTLPSIEAIISALRKMVRDDRSYAILWEKDIAEPRHDLGCGWSDGGCGILARALTTLRPDARTHALRDGSKEGRVQHFGTEIDGWVVDGHIQERSVEAWMDAFARTEMDKDSAPYVTAYEIEGEWERNIPLDSIMAGQIAALLLTIIEEEAPWASSLRDS